MFKVNQVLLTETTSGAVKQDTTRSEGTAALGLGGRGRQLGAREGRVRKVMSSTLFNLQLLLIFDLKRMK